MSIQELIDEANEKRNIWLHKPEEGLIFPNYYGGEESYILWIKKTEKYLREKFENNVDAKRFLQIVSNKTSHYTNEFEEMLCCLQMLVGEKEQTPVVVNGKDLIDLSIVDKAPNYIINVLNEANLCYKYSIYNGCAVLLRKATENLIIEAFDRNNRINEIQDNNGDFFTLKNLISKLLNAQPSLWNITRNTKKSLDEIKKIGDLSAHNIKFCAKKTDIDSIIEDYRLTLQEINISIYS